MAAGDIYNLRDQQTYLGQDCETVYWIKHVAGASGAAVLSNAWIIGPHVNINSIQQTGVADNQLVIININDTLDFGTFVTLSGGVRPGEAMPPYAAWGFILRSSDRRVRSIGKRYVGVSETDQLDGDRVAGIVAAMDGLENALTVSFQNASATDTYEVIIYTTGNSQTSGLPLEVAVPDVDYRALTTQNSRKFS